MKNLRIIEERKKLGLSQKELASKLKISQKSISKYECGTRRPSYEILMAMSSLFGVSTDYLLGNSDKSEKPASEIATEKENKQGFFFFFFEHWQEYLEKLHSEMSKQNITEKDFQKYVGIAVEEEPTIDHLIKISNLLHISIDYLLGLSSVKNISSDSIILTSKEQNIINTFRCLNDDNQDILIGEAKKSLKEQRYEESVAADEPLKEAK